MHWILAGLSESYLICNSPMQLMKMCKLAPYGVIWRLCRKYIESEWVKQTSHYMHTWSLLSKSAGLFDKKSVLDQTKMLIRVFVGLLKAETHRPHWNPNTHITTEQCLSNVCDDRSSNTTFAARIGNHLWLLAPGILSWSALCGCIHAGCLHWCRLPGSWSFRTPAIPVHISLGHKVTPTSLGFPIFYACLMRSWGCLEYKVW